MRAVIQRVTGSSVEVDGKTVGWVSMPGYGKAKAAKVMSELKIAESRRLRGLGERQQAALLERLG